MHFDQTESISGRTDWFNIRKKINKIYYINQEKALDVFQYPLVILNKANKNS